MYNFPLGAFCNTIVMYKLFAYLIFFYLSIVGVTMPGKEYYTKSYLSKKLIELERRLRKYEKRIGIKVYPWLVNQNPKNQGNKGKTRDLTYTDKQLSFCQEYLIDMNATQAAIRAGYGKAGAATQGSLLLKQEKIQAKISQINKKRMKRLNINADSVIKEIALIAFSNIGNLASWTNSQVTLKESSRLTMEQMAGIQTVEEKITRYGSAVKLKMYDKPQALVLLCRYLNILDGNATVTDPDDTAKKLKEAYLAMFQSVPVQEDPNSLEDIKNGPVREFPPEIGKTATSKPVPDTERLQKPLPFSEPKPEEMQCSVYAYVPHLYRTHNECPFNQRRKIFKKEKIRVGQGKTRSGGNR